MSHARAAILAIGDELTLGQSLDTNSAWIAARLLDVGITAAEHVTVPDDSAAIAAALRRLAAAADVLICTGGLGPTPDDLTRAALAEVLGEPLVEDEAALAGIEAYFARRGRTMPPANRVQALRPGSAEMLTNDHGTAPGLTARVGGVEGCDVYCLPGPPAEMMPMLSRHVLPRLRPPAGRRIATLALHTACVAESEVARRLGELMDRGRMPLVGTTASRGVVTCRLRYEGDADSARVLAAAEAQVRERLAPHVFGAGDDTPASVVLALLTQRGEKLATVESCTGGMLGAAITAVAGSSAAYLGGWVTYSNDLKRSQVGVPDSVLAPGGPGAVSAECAAAMAAGGLERSDGQHCLAITGIAGPDGGSAEKPVGTVWIALASRDAPAAARCFRFLSGRESVRVWSVNTALEMLRLRMVGASGVKLTGEV